MARPGITYREVAEVAAQLVSKGQNPTIERIRLLLGTGSSTTISNHLRQWKGEHIGEAHDIHKEHIPQELNTIVKGLWEKIVSESEEKIQTIEKTYQKQFTDIQQELDKYKGNNQRWQHLYTQWLEEKKHITLNKHELEQTIHQLEDEITLLKGKVENGAQQIQEKQERIKELNQLHQQAQRNLELYRETTNEQAARAQSQFDQQRLEWQRKLNKLDEQWNKAKEQAASLQQSLQFLQKSHMDLEKNLKHAQAAVEKQRESLLVCEKAKAEHAQSSTHWQEMYHKAQTMIEDKNLQLINSQSEIKSLSHQLKLANQALSDVMKQNKLLEKHNWALEQKHQGDGPHPLPLSRERERGR